MRGLGVALGALLALVPLGGCSIAEQRERFAHRLDLVEDTLGAPPSPRAEGPPVEVDLVCDRFEGDARLVLAALVEALDHDPRLRLQSLRYQGHDASSGRRRRALGRAPLEVHLRCDIDASGSALNPLIAFPGMIAFAPMWLGYRWDVELRLEARTLVRGRPGPARTRTFEVAVRDRNAPRSALFHLWPLTGFFGTQFVLGLVLAPTMLFYDGEETTPLLVTTLGPRLGRALAGPVVEAARAAAATARAPGG
jgi:hypothetical protein